VQGVPGGRTICEHCQIGRTQIRKIRLGDGQTFTTLENRALSICSDSDFSVDCSAVPLVSFARNPISVWPIKKNEDQQHALWNRSFSLSRRVIGASGLCSDFA
jgi:hypothetical protein